MSFQAMTWAVGQKLPSSQKIVLLMLANHTNGHTGQCTPRIKLLAEECGMSENSVKNQIKALAQIGLIEIKTRHADGQQLANAYRLNLGVVGQPLAPGGPTIGPGVGQPLGTVEPGSINQEVETKTKSIDISDKKQSENPLSGGNKIPPCPYEKIVSLWNEKMPELPRVEKIHETRKRHLAARWRENPEMQNLEAWSKFLGFVRESKFLMGKSMPTTKHPTPFRLTFDYLINASNFVKIYENNYA